MNAELAFQVLSELSQLGVKEYCVCPGARNAPLVAALSSLKSQLKTYYFFDERSAAFFALGRIRSTGSPVAVVTTSGTAVGELLCATMEGYYSGLPLILLTADRPRSYRGSGAPQAADQVNLFGIYVSGSLDWEEEERPPVSSYFNPFRPLHVNICFDEPLLEQESAHRPVVWDSLSVMKPDLSVKARNRGMEVAPSNTQIHQVREAFESFLKATSAPLALVGMLRPDEREAVAELLIEWNIPTYFEAISGLREDSRLAHLRIHRAEKMIERASQNGYVIDGVVRIGGVPTLRTWRDLESTKSHLPVLSLSPLSFTGLARKSILIQENLNGLSSSLIEILKARVSSRAEFPKRYQQSDQKAQERLRDLLASEPQSEAGLFSDLSQKLPRNTRLYLGNSLPIREWDLAATHEYKGHEVWASRGLNGIDGQVSTFLGYCQPGKTNWAIVGDLTALYDLQGPWVLNQMKDFSVTIAVINNGGGQIFSRMFPQPEFVNAHQVQFKPWAELWGLSYEEWRAIPLNISSPFESQLIEIVPDEAATARFWKEFGKIDTV